MYVAKRITDVLLSLIGIIILIPLTGIIGILIKLDSRGPVFYLVDRVGKDMKIFKMFKFRTMIETPICIGDSVCPKYDPRVTTFGRFLRRTKINEVPQVINILKGEMTFVGPRPEAPDLAKLYPEEAKKIFSFKPGFVSPATIIGRNEEEKYPPGVDAKKYYIEKILPPKVKIDLKYLENLNFFKEFQYILIGVKETLFGVLKKKHIYDNLSQIYLIFSDVFLIICSYILATFLCSKNILTGPKLVELLICLPLFTVILLSCNIYFGVYTCVIRYISYHEVWGILEGVTSGSFIFALIVWLFNLENYSSMILIINWALLIFILSGFRFTLKIYWRKKNSVTNGYDKCKIIIFGANDAGIYAYKSIMFDKNSPFKVVGFIDDSPQKYGKSIYGVRVLGNRHHIKAIVQLYKVDEIFLVDPYANKLNLNEIIGICQKIDLRYRIFSTLNNNKVDLNKTLFRALKIKEILPSENIDIDQNSLKEIFAGKTALVYGSGGALGMELCSQILKLGCRKLIIVDRYESYLNELVASLFNAFSQGLIIPVLSNSDKIETLEEVFENHQADIVFHAGMRKYEPLLSLYVDEVGQANYERTFNLAKVASKFKCELFVMISSLAAARGGNPIADSLRVAEVSLEHFFNDTNTRLIIVRIGDVIENRGGIVSILEDQIRKQEPLTLPSADVQACLISKYSATAFILQAIAEANATALEGGVFTCKCSSPVPLVEVARKIADLYGFKLSADLPIKYIAQSKEHNDLPLINLSSSTTTDELSIKFVKANTGITSEEVKSVFKAFVLADNDKSALQDWKARTRELIKLSGREIFVSES